MRLSLQVVGQVLLLCGVIVLAGCTKPLLREKKQPPPTRY